MTGSSGPERSSVAPASRGAIHAGDAYYGAPGHLPLVFAGTEIVEFSPTAELNRTMEVVGRNLAGAQS
ncbi:hypothetical protein ACWC09_30490 [Streptomyces sp. NPDC001617]